LGTTPTRRRESYGQAQEGVSAIGRPPCRERTTRSAGGIGYRLGRGAVLSRDLLGHGGVRTSQGRLASAVSAPATSDSSSRYFHACVPLARPGGLRGRIPALYGGVCQGHSVQSRRGGGDRRQSASWRFRARLALRASPPGQCLCGGSAHVAGAAEGSWP